jgi:hypothetical protein
MKLQVVLLLVVVLVRCFFDYDDDDEYDSKVQFKEQLGLPSPESPSADRRSYFGGVVFVGAGEGAVAVGAVVDSTCGGTRSVFVLVSGIAGFDAGAPGALPVGIAPPGERPDCSNFCWKLLVVRR